MIRKLGNLSITSTMLPPANQSRESLIQCDDYVFIEQLSRQASVKKPHDIQAACEQILELINKKALNPFPEAPPASPDETPSIGR